MEYFDNLDCNEVILQYCFEGSKSADGGPNPLGFELRGPDPLTDFDRGVQSWE